MPFDQQPVRPQTAMQRTGRDAVQIGLIFPADGAKPVQIEVRVAKLERIERPLNEPDSATQGFGSLKEFQHAANTPVAVFAVHAGHVGVQVRDATLESDDRERETHETIAIERAQHFPARMRGDDEQRGRLNLQVRFSPNFALQVHATMKFIEAFAFANNNIRAHRLARAPLRSIFCSVRLARSQSASISSRGRFLNSRPPSRASFSMERNLRENFALAFFRAISGSTFRNRARFTAAKSKSPSSSSTFRCSRAPKAFCNSLVSSPIFSKLPVAFSQSKPMREALRVS